MKSERPSNSEITQPDSSEALTRSTLTLICFSHLRWNSVFQRPHHLMTRLVKQANVIFWEEWIAGEGAVEPRLELIRDPTGVLIARPILPVLDDTARDAVLLELLERLLVGYPNDMIGWYYTPMMRNFSSSLPFEVVVYDCMDELSQFRFAPLGLREAEDRLFESADIVFTGGPSLFRAKSEQHRNVHCFPSSIDTPHFSRARKLREERRLAARDQPPTLGYFGVLDERIDLTLIADLADARPGWRFEFVGPIAKLAPGDLPSRPNVRYLGPRDYADLPAISANWDVALMPFALNAATQFISPTKTPEYLAAGLPVVSTSISDVVELYGECPSLLLANGPNAFASACDDALKRGREPQLIEHVDALLAKSSWDSTVGKMFGLIEASRSPATRCSSSAPRTSYDVLVVGAGFAGCVMAERFAREAGKRVLVVDTRDHIGGNAYDYRDAAGILIHRYGPHIFHTNSQAVVDYLSQFTAWRPYEHRVRAAVQGRLMPVPINRTTLNELYGTDLRSDADAAAFLAERAEYVPNISTSEDVVVAAVGRELYELFFRGYTRKQWGCDPAFLSSSVTARVATRTNKDDRYFLDTFQAMPARGYTAMFERMLDHPNVQVAVATSFEDVRKTIQYELLVYTGPIDEYFGFCFGRLPYRSLQFSHENRQDVRFQPVGVINYPDEAVPYTRVTEYKHLTGQIADSTSITYEYPCAEGDPFYPIPNPENAALYKQYESLALSTPNTMFVGRLATYRYYNMDQVIGQALATYRRYLERDAA